MARILASLFISAALAAPVALQALDQDDHVKHYYDADHRDYHDWNSKEDGYYHGWLKERHYKDHDWSHASKHQQQEYWKWRHDHPDGH